MMWFLRKGRKPLGRRGENAAAKHLRRLGYRILERNARFGRCEIDIIAQEGDTIAFVEVKTRSSDAFLAPEKSITVRKRAHIRQAAQEYIRKRDDPTRYYRFDVVSVVIPDQSAPVVTLRRDAFPNE